MKVRDYTDLAAPGVRELKPYLPGKPISELEREYGVSDSIKLASNENPLGASPRAVEAARAVLADSWLYPDANGFELKRALAARHNVPPEAITLGNGSNDVLVFLAQAFLQPGQAVVFSQYAFAVYPIATQMMSARADVAPALPADHPAMPLGHDLRAMFEKVGDDTRLVFVANPNNPTGTWLDGERLKDFIGSLPPHVICVVDEAYTEYAESDRLGDASAWLEEFPNLVVTRTFSKAYGLAGLRPAFNVNAPALAAAQAALEDTAFIEKTRQMNSEGKKQLEAGLKKLGVTTIPSATNFLLAGFDRPGAELNEALLQRGIIVRPVANYGLDNHLRITIGTREQNERLLTALAEILEN